MLQHCYNAKNGMFYGFVQIMLTSGFFGVCLDPTFCVIAS